MANGEDEEDGPFLASLPPLIRAAACGDLVEVRRLLDAGHPPDESEDAWSALHAASTRGHASIVVALLDAGSAVDAPAGGVTALWNASGPSPSAETVRLLLEAGADPNATDPLMGWSPLDRATQYCKAEIASLLIKAGADVNYADEKGWTLLMTAAETGCTSVARLLLAAGANPSAACDGKTAGDIALEHGHVGFRDLVVGRAGA